MFESNQITDWSQNDAAAIRLLYSRWIESGMTATQAEASLRRYAHSVD